jgi:dinuclear metal center YbgI/SA1388 family protein
MNRAQFHEELEAIAPFEFADEYDRDRIGLVIEGRSEIGHICCALDVTPHVVREAITSGADALVVHHAPLWDPVTRITGRFASNLSAILSAGLNVYVVHTNFDRAPGGVNDTLADILGLEDRTAISLGIVGRCTRSLEDMIRLIGGAVRIYGSIGPVVRLAVVGGSGFDPELIEEAVSSGADAYLSAELKHSVMRGSSIPLIESTHYALEAPAMHRLSQRMGWEYIDDPPQMAMMA